MRRGDLFWARFPMPVGRRPVVLVSRDEAYAIKTRISVIAVTRTVRGIPTEVRLGPGQGLPKACVANADELVTIPSSVLEEHIGTLGQSKLNEINAALRFSLAVD